MRSVSYVSTEVAVEMMPSGDVVYTVGCWCSLDVHFSGMICLDVLSLPVLAG